MKKSFYVTAVLLLLAAGPLSAEDFLAGPDGQGGAENDAEAYPAFAQNLDFAITGVYLPVEYIEALERTKHNPLSWAFNTNGGIFPHSVYIVDAYTIQAGGRYDGIFNIYLWDIFKFRFEKTGGDIFLIDHENHRFRKLPGDLYEYEDWQAIIGNFVGKIILDELIKSGDIILNNDLVIFPALDNTIFRIQWQAYDPKGKMNLRLEGVADNRILSLEIRQNEYVFYGYHYFSTDIVWSKCYDKTDIYPAEADFYGVWINNFDVKHIIGADEWTFLSPNGNNYTVSGLVWTKATNYNPASAADYPYGYSITGTIASIRYNGPTFLSTGYPCTVRYFIHKTDKAKISTDDDPPIDASFFSKASDTDNRLVQ